ncbi:MAG: M55 family metallopeptidase [Bacillota bacterium]|nr:M55 family metallopeptidase [Bacillota bacterium]
MRIYVSADMEGIAGITSRELQLVPEGREFAEARLLLTEEVNAAIRGAYDAGATYVLVNDSHGHMNNILPDRLDPRAELSQGYPKPLYMMEGISGEFDAVFFVGYHAAIGTADGILNHSYNSRGIYNVRVGGKLMSESMLNGRVAGHYGVPVALVTGDAATIRQTQADAPGVHGAVVKWSYNRGSARFISPERAREVIAKAAADAVRSASAGGAHGMLMAERIPVRWEIDWVYTVMADMACLVPGVKRVADRSIEFESPDYLVGFKQFQAVTMLSYLV